MKVSTNLGRVSLAPRGAYDPSATYQRLDIVQYEGSGYLVLKNEITGIVPTDGADYMLLAMKGGKGDIGDQGIQGIRGKKGDKGDPGERGEPGNSIASIDRTGGTGAAGTTDTYTITLTDGSTTTFQVRNGADGDGAGDMTKSVYDPQGKAQDIFRYVDDAVSGLGGDWEAEGTAQQLIGEHAADPDAHEERFAAMEARCRHYVVAVRIRDPGKPDYGLNEGDVVLALDTGPRTDGAEIAVIVSGVEYDAKNMSVSREDLPDGTLILTKIGGQNDAEHEVHPGTDQD